MVPWVLGLGFGLDLEALLADCRQEQLPVSFLEGLAVQLSVITVAPQPEAQYLAG